MKKIQHKYSIVEKNYLLEPRTFDSGELYQIGRMKCDPAREIALHAHLNWFELTVVLDGLGTVVTNGVSQSVGSGDVYLSFPGEFHYMISDEKRPMEFLYLAFYPSDALHSEQLESIMARYGSPHRRIFRDDRVTQTVKNMLREITEPDKYMQVQFSSMLSQVQIYVIRNFDSEQEKNSDESASKEFCRRIMNYVDTHLYTLESLSEVADATHYNYSYISNLFKSTTGETLQKYYCRRRLEAARLLLLENNLSVTEISEVLHYSSIFTFSRAYKDHFGHAPTSERKA